MDINNKKPTSNINRDKDYGLSANQYCDIINHIMSANKDEVNATMDKIKAIKSGTYNKYAATKDMTSRHLATIPPTIYWYFAKKYPGFWSNKNNVDKFLAIFKMFVIPEKI